MYKHSTKIRVRYADTDKMGIVYHGKYVEYLEVARTEALRNIGIDYSKMEEEGIMMPVTKINLKYIGSALYDQVIEVVTILNALPEKRIVFNYKIYNDNNQLLTIGETELAFISNENQKSIQAPLYLLNSLKTFF